MGYVDKLETKHGQERWGTVWTWDIYIIKRELTNGCSGLGAFFAPIHLSIHGSKTGLIGGIVISETWTFQPDG